MRVYQSGSSDSIATVVEEKRPIVLTSRGSVRIVIEHCIHAERHTYTSVPHQFGIYKNSFHKIAT